MEYKVREALGLAQSHGCCLSQTELGAKLWPELTPNSQINMASRLINGKMRKIDADLIIKICDLCGCTPNFLCGWE